MFCILPAISKVRSAVVPPAPQVISQKVGSCVAMRSILSNRFSTPCMRDNPCPRQVAHNSDLVADGRQTNLFRARRKKLKREKSLPSLLSRIHFVYHLHDERDKQKVTQLLRSRSQDTLRSSAKPISCGVTQSCQAALQFTGTASHADPLQPIVAKWHRCGTFERPRRAFAAPRLRFTACDSL